MSLGNDWLSNDFAPHMAYVREKDAYTNPFTNKMVYSWLIEVQATSHHMKQWWPTFLSYNSKSDHTMTLVGWPLLPISTVIVDFDSDICYEPEKLQTYIYIYNMIYISLITTACNESLVSHYTIYICIYIHLCCIKTPQIVMNISISCRLLFRISEFNIWC